MNNENLDIEILHSSWMRNMFQMITLGIVLLTFFRSHNKLRKYSFIPIIIIITGIIVGLFSVIYSYYFSNNQRHIYKWKYISKLIILTFLFVAVYIIRYLKINY